MIIGVDSIQLESNGTTVNLGSYKDIEAKYVAAVDNKVDILITRDKETAKYFRENGIASFVEI